MSDLRMQWNISMVLFFVKWSIFRKLCRISLMRNYIVLILRQCCAFLRAEFCNLFLVPLQSFGSYLLRIYNLTLTRLKIMFCYLYTDAEIPYEIMQFISFGTLAEQPHYFGLCYISVAVNFKRSRERSFTFYGLHYDLFFKS